MKLSLRVFLAVAFTAIATVPVVYMALWVERTALQKEVDSVREKHLLLAKNITAALERYAADVDATFEHLVSYTQVHPVALASSMKMLSDRFDIRTFEIIDSGGRAGLRISNAKPASNLSSQAFETIKRSAGTASQYTPVMADTEGRPTIYVHRRLDDGRFAVAALGTDYIVKLQKAISFGRKGHAAIVDQTGRVLAHPRKAWARDMKNISKVLPVRRMIAGDTGVAQFFSPAMKKDMISGYTVVSGSGWGVMVPQPIDELEARANDVFKIALAVGAAGLLSAVFLGLLVAGALSSTLRNVVSVTRAIRKGDLDSRVTRRPVYTPSEFSELASAVNEMADHIRDNQAVMEHALHDAQKADRAKSEFLANMSHELRTPLNAIIGFSELLMLQSPNQEKVAVYAADINSSGNHLLDVISDILDIARIESGHIEMSEEETEVEAFIRAAIKLVEPQASSAGLQIEMNIEAGIRPIVLDPVKQRQVLANLLSNSVKFTPTGGKISVDAWTDSDDVAAFRISDNGIGMSDVEVEVALSPFGQVESALNRSREGTGLGLPLAKRFVELQGGEFELTSKPGIGTIVIVRYPPPSSKELAA